jgi:rSAM/selenodomain-associated transferase 1
MGRSANDSCVSDGPPAPAQVVVMAKYPAPGSVKTRLAAQIGGTAACRLYTAFVGDLADRLARARLPVCWAVWPPEAPFAALIPGQRCIAQVGRDLGERLDAAIRACAGASPLPVIAIGADAPHLEPACLLEAAAALGGGADVVLGPAADGGYYLIGLRTPCAALFQGIEWGSSSVLAATLARAQAARLRVHLLAETFDVDDVAGLAALRALLERDLVELPRTAAVLAELAPVIPAAGRPPPAASPSSDCVRGRRTPRRRERSRRPRPGTA